MFTGLIEEIGIIENIIKGSNFASIVIRAEKVLDGLKLGDSIATNGVCLTVTDFNKNSFTVDIMPESMDRSNLKDIVRGSEVNLERAMKSGDRFGGHIVSGHIDGKGKLILIRKDGNAHWLEIEAPDEIMRYIVFKGSVTLDGTSLTVAKVNEKNFSVSIIPLTGEETTLLRKNIGDEINIECDLIGKYIEKLINIDLSDKKEKRGIDSAFLKENGFI
ncbi:MAG: riboflavin synthase [Andreesenia angusta]|nr:riboflavin synthase [Andreesenia angusta]